MKISGGSQTSRWTIRLLFFLGAFSLLALFSGAGKAQAHAPHASHLSPFAMKTKALDHSRSHCLLHQLGDLQTPCPHARGQGGHHKIGPECGGSPNGHVPASSVAQHNPGVEEIPAASASSARSLPIAPVTTAYHPPLLENFTPPPERISLI